MRTRTKTYRTFQQLCFAAAAAASFVFFSSHAWAGYRLTNTASVLFSARGPAGLNIEGRASTLSMTEDSQAFLFSVPTSQFETGISLRDRHLRERYLEASRFPVARLSIAKTALTPQILSGGRGTIVAQLDLHGERRPVNVRYTIEVRDGKTAVNASFEIDIRNFKIEPPSYLGMTVRPEVKVAVQLVAGPT